MTRLAPSTSPLAHHPFAELNDPKRLPGYSYKLAEGYGLDVAFTDQLDIDEKKMAVWIPYADGQRRDGVGDLLVVEGIDESRHRKNPIHLFDHGKSTVFPVGTVEDPETGRYTGVIDPVTKCAKDLVHYYQGTGLPGIDKAAEYDHALFCAQLFHLLAKRFIRGGSIGYQVLQARELPPEPMYGTPKGLLLLSVLKLESSTVVMPANADTVRKGQAPDLREVLAMSSVCGKPLSPMLVKSLSAYAPVNTKTVSGYGGKAVPPSPDAATVHIRQPYAQAQAASQMPRMGVRQKPDGYYVYDPTTGQDQFGPFFSEGIAQRWAERLNMGKKNVKDLRKKYRRTAKGLVRRLKRSSPGSSVIYLAGKDLEQARKEAESKGIKFQHVSSRNGTARVKLIGDDGAIDEVAKSYGRLVKFQVAKALNTKGLLDDTRQFHRWLDSNLPFRARVIKRRIGQMTLGADTFDDLHAHADKIRQLPGVTRVDAPGQRNYLEVYFTPEGYKSQPLGDPFRSNVHAGTEEAGETVIARRAIMDQTGREYFAQPGDRLTVVPSTDVGFMRVRNRAGVERNVISNDVRRKSMKTKAANEWNATEPAAYGAGHDLFVNGVWKKVVRSLGPKQHGGDPNTVVFELEDGSKFKWKLGQSVKVRDSKALKGTKANPLTLIVVGDEVEVIPGSGGHTQYHGGDRGIVKEVRPTGYVIQIPGEPRPTTFEKDEVKLVRKKSMKALKVGEPIENPNLDPCPVCGRPARHPYRNDRNGEICVAACHDQHLQLSSEAARARKQRRAILGPKSERKELFKGIKSMRNTKTKDADDLPVGDEDTTVSGEERQLPLGAQVLRRLHEDATLLLQDYDEMLGPLENENVKSRLQGKLEGFTEELTELEEEFGKLYPDLGGLVGTKEGELEEAADLESDGEPDNDKEEYEEELEPTPKDMDTMDDDAVGSSSEEREEVSPEDALEGMEAAEEEEEGEKSLRNGRNIKSLRKKYRKKGFCPECQKEDCVCGEKGVKIAPALVAAAAPVVGGLVGGALSNRDKGYVKEAGGFLGDIGQPDSILDDEGRMKSYHYHKTLSGMSQLDEAREDLEEGSEDLQDSGIPPAEFEPGAGAKGVGQAVAAAARHPRVRAAARGAARGAAEGFASGKATDERQRTDTDSEGTVRSERNEITRAISNPSPDPKPGQPAEISLRKKDVGAATDKRNEPKHKLRTGVVGAVQRTVDTAMRPITGIGSMSDKGQMEILGQAADFLKELAFLPELDDEWRGRSTEFSKGLNDFVGPDEEAPVEDPNDELPPDEGAPSGAPSGDPEGVVMEEGVPPEEEEPGMEMKFLAEEATLQNKKIAELSRMLSRLPI